MSKCEEWKKKIIKCFDNEADDEEQRQVTKHVQDCSTCREFSDKYTKITQAFRSISEPTLPFSIRHTLIEKIQADIRCDSMEPLSIVKKRGNFLGLRCPGMRWYIRVAALLVVVTLVTVCMLLAQENLTLRRDLLLAHQKLELLQQQEQIVRTQDSQQKTVSELLIRVKQLEGQMQRSISPLMALQSEPPYCRPERPGGS